jgi:hypothetical protein
MKNTRILMQAPRFLIIGYKKAKKENFYCLYLDDQEAKEFMKGFYRNTGKKENGFEILKPKENFSELTAEEKNEFLEKIIPVMLKKPKKEDDLNFDALHCTTPFIENFCKVLTPLVDWALENEMDISNILSLIQSQNNFFVTIFTDEKQEVGHDIGVKGDNFIIDLNDKILATNDLEVIKNYIKG